MALSDPKRQALEPTQAESIDLFTSSEIDDSSMENQGTIQDEPSKGGEHEEPARVVITSDTSIGSTGDDFEPTNSIGKDNVAVNFTEEELILAVLSIDEEDGEGNISVLPEGDININPLSGICVSDNIEDQLLLPEILSDDDDDLFLRDDNLRDFYNQEYIDNPAQQVDLLEPEQLETVFDNVLPVRVSIEGEKNYDEGCEASSEEDDEVSEESLNDKADDSRFHEEIGNVTDDDDDAALFDVDDLLEEEEQWRRQVNRSDDENDSPGAANETNDFFVDQFHLLLPPLPEQDLKGSTPLPEDDSNSLLYCQPCIPAQTAENDDGSKEDQINLLQPESRRPPRVLLPPSLAPISESEPVHHVNPDNSPGRGDIIGQLERLNISTKSDVKHTRKSTMMDASSSNHHGESNGYPIRTQALEAASPFLDAFGCHVASSLGNNNDSLSSERISDSKDSSQSNERSCFGHKETIFGVAFSYCGKYCATASQDSTIRIWNVDTNRLLATLTDHSKDYECLRVAWASPMWADDCLDRGDEFQYLLASGGADGIVKLWGTPNPETPKCIVTLDHSTLLGRNKTNAPEETGGVSDGETKEDNKPQVYALQFIDHWQAFTSQMSASAKSDSSKNSFLMTSSDDYIHFWEVQVQKEHPPTPQIIELDENKELEFNDDPDGEVKISLKEVMSLHFTSLEHYGYGVRVANVTGLGLDLPSKSSTAPGSDVATTNAFGGDRNPDNVIFVFDASYCSANGLLGVALSDGSLRLVNGRGICLSVLTLPGCQSHLTSFSWDSTGRRLATCVATGHLISWTISGNDFEPTSNPVSSGGASSPRFDSHFVATCTAILEGGHQPGRPLFGCAYCGRNSSDSGDSLEQENLLVSWGVDGRLCLWDSYSQGNVESPIGVLRDQGDYPVYAVAIGTKGSSSTMKETYIAVGGGSEGGFIGIPLYLYKVEERAPSTATSATVGPNSSGVAKDVPRSTGSIPSENERVDTDSDKKTIPSSPKAIGEKNQL